MALDEQIRLMMTQQDKAILEEIARRDGDAGMSATIRRLIRQESERRGIVSQPQQPTDNQPVR